MELASSGPTQPGANVELSLSVSGASGPVEVRWNFGDGTRTDFAVGALNMVHSYPEPGRYVVTVLARDASSLDDAAYVHTVHRPLTPKRPAASTDMIYDEARQRIYVVNTDNDSVSVIDPVKLEKTAELSVLAGPEGLALAPDGRLWVVQRGAGSIAIVDLDALNIVQQLALPRGSQPIAVAMSPTGDAAYATLMATGELLKLDPLTGSELGRLLLGPFPRGIAVSHDGSEVLVTRFISPDSGGEVAHVNAASMTELPRIVLPPDTTTEDTDQKGRGLPNYLFSVTIAPDATQAWVTAKKDNIFRGPLRDGQNLTPDNIVRPLVSRLSLEPSAAGAQHHIDLDDRNLPTFVEFAPYSDYAFVSVTGSALVEVRDAFTGGFITAIREMGYAPRGLVLTPDQRLFVNAALSRNVAVYDASAVLKGGSTAKKLADIALVQSEKLDPMVLLGKQVFMGSADKRMSDVGYISCASCHFDGFEDGRVWDLTEIGEGLRNTVSLLGRRGTAHGALNWTGNSDEVQDVEHSIRALFGGTGFIPTEQLTKATSEPLAGKSPELDAVQAYLASLVEVNPSPARMPDGASSPDALAGQVLFDRLGCGFCHAGAEGTDSVRGRLHDVGTLKPSSGSRAGEPLRGLDTPTLQGIWETAPYLHDGSAPTLRDVLTTANPEDRHGFVSSLSSIEVDQLVAYLREFDATPDVVNGGGGTSGSGNDGVAGGTPPPMADESRGSGCGVGPATTRDGAWSMLGLLLTALSARRRRKA